MWMLNFAGVVGLIAFYWISSSPAQKIYPALMALDVTATATMSAQPSFTPEIELFGSIDTPVFPAFKNASTSTATPEPTDDGKNPKVIGYSVAGRPLEIYRFGNGPTGRLIVAGIHGGNEYNTINLANELIAYVESHPETIPENITLFILPNLNPDGEARKHGVDGRVNDNGVDLNRNWPYRWEKDYDRSNCWHYRPTTAGEYAGSEPETAALINFIESHPEIDALISYHAAALGIFAGGVPDYQPSIRLAKSFAKVSDYQYPPKDIGCVYTGNFTDWASSVREIAAVDIELHNFRYTDLDANLKILKVFLKFKK
jgi:Zinc carboxypeptidase